jgi:tetratricopeptide (TPR) repeat protein
MGLARTWQGDFAQGDRLAAESCRVAREHGLLTPLIRGLWAHGIALTSAGAFDAALLSLEEGLAKAEKVGDEALIPRLLNTTGWLFAECENHARSIEFNLAGAEQARARRHAIGLEMTAYALVNLGDTYLGRRDLAAAREAFEEARHIAEDPRTLEWMKWRYTIHLLVSLGELAVASGDPGSAAGFAERSLDLADATSSPKYQIRNWRLKALVAVHRQQFMEAEAALQRALRIAQQTGNPPELWKTQIALGRLQTDRGRQEAAQRSYAAARRTIDRVLSQLADSELRASLRNADTVKEAYEFSSAG